MNAHTLRLFSLKRGWFSSVNTETAKGDALAGLTNAAIVLPQGVAFAVIAGLPPEYGLYTAMITAAIAALWGSSMIMVSGPTTAISAVMFAALTELSPPGTPQYIHLALTLTVMVGVFQIIAAAMRLSAIFSFISHSVMVGFTTAAALLIAGTQIGSALGLEIANSHGIISSLSSVASDISDANSTACLIAFVSFVSIFIVQRLSRKLPAYLLALGGGALLGHFLDASEQGVRMFASIPSIFPSFGVPSASSEAIIALVPSAISIGFIGLLEALSIGRAFAMRRGEPYDSEQEIIGQGISNAVGGFFQAYAGSGSFTRSALNAESGARTPLAAVFSSLFLLVLLLLVAPFVTLIPVPAMSGIIMFVAWRLINWHEIGHIVKTSWAETGILAVTLIAGIFVNLETAVLAGAGVSLAIFLGKCSKVSVTPLAPVDLDGSQKLRSAAFHHASECPQIQILRIEGNLFFGSIEGLTHELEKTYRYEQGLKIKILVLHGSPLVDLSAAQFLVSEIRKTRNAGGDVQVVAPRGQLPSLKRMQVEKELGSQNLHTSKSQAISHALALIDGGRCKQCERRVFNECSGQNC